MTTKTKKKRMKHMQGMIDFVLFHMWFGRTTNGAWLHTGANGKHKDADIYDLEPMQ